MFRINNLKSIKPKRKNLRRNMPQAEIILWSRLKTEQLNGLKFRRQHSIGKYIIDFYCPKHKLAIEIDGVTHENRERQDGQREKYISSFGIKTIRFSNHNIYKNLDDVLEYILNSIPPRPTATPP